MSGEQKTAESFNERISKGINMPDDELIRRCDEWVFSLAKSGGDSWVLSIPVRFDKDPDMLFTELGKRLNKRNEQNAALKEALSELIPIAEDAVTLLERHSTRKSDHVDKEWQDIIDRAKKLLDKQPQSESDKTE